MELKNWISLHRLDAQISSNICTLNEKKYLILEEEIIFDSDFNLNLSKNHQAILVQGGIEDVVFEFGNNWYCTAIDDVKLTPFRYIGKEVSEFSEVEFPYLGIHGEYDLCNGSRTYDEWCKKAKFLNTTTLGICENNTLAGTLSFQLACKSNGIKSIIGETVTVSKDIETYKVKLYVKDYTGWVNLLNINSQIKVFNDGYVNEEYLLSKYAGLVCVMTGPVNHKKILDFKKIFGEDLYYQIDFVEWSSQDNDEKYLENLKNYFSSFSELIKPVLICDSYYLDKDHAHIKKILNSIGKVGFQHQSTDQYFKSLKDIYFQIDEISSNEDWPVDIILNTTSNAIEIKDKCNFEIKLGELHLPSYEMTELEKSKYSTNEDLFFALIEKGLERIKDYYVRPEEEYLERIELEVEVIKSGNLIDYFLILADIIEWSRKNDILTGVGRGSAAGSLISYLLNITQIDPLQYGLLFFRFLNPGRIGKSLPDIDSDFASNRRDDVKRYMEERYGIDYVTSIGTFGTFKIKQGLTDLCREYNFDLKTTKYITSIIGDDANMSFTDFFRLALKNDTVKKFIVNNPHIVEDYPLIMDQVKTSSVHAAGVIIVPKEYNGNSMTIYDWMPVKKIGDILVTEWEGPVLEDAGFLKEDILGTKQLEKIHDILELIKNNKKEVPDLNRIPLDDNDVFELFRGGNNEDVFQFGAPGLQAYCRDLQPVVLDDLIATQALYRPGPMDSGMHKSYIKVKNGERSVEYDYMMEEITKDTYGFAIYQEQIMQAMVVVGGFTDVEADNVRKALGKKDMDKMAKYKPLFLKGAEDRGCDKYAAINMWNKFEAFATYAFNKSHAAAYTITGYQCQWLKFHFPLEFWSVALNFSDSKNIGRRISEMHRVSTVKVLPPDINLSTDRFEADIQNNVIFWSISSISQIGDKTLEAIMNQRKEGGKFFSFDEFYKRIEKRSVNKRHVTNLILSGCFDNIEKIKSPSQRLTLLKRFVCDICNEQLPEEFANSSDNWKDYLWILKQKELTGFGYLDFDKIYKSNILSKIESNKVRYVTADLFQDESSEGDNKCIVGTISEIVERKMKSKPGTFAEITFNCNDESVICLMWTEQWETYKEIIKSSKNKILAVTGKIVFDGKYKNKNVLQTTNNSQVVIL